MKNALGIAVRFDSLMLPRVANTIYQCRKVWEFKEHGDGCPMDIILRQRGIQPPLERPLREPLGSFKEAGLMHLWTTRIFVGEQHACLLPNWHQVTAFQDLCFIFHCTNRQMDTHGPLSQLKCLALHHCTSMFDGQIFHFAPLRMQRFCGDESEADRFSALRICEALIGRLDGVGTCVGLLKLLVHVCFHFQNRTDLLIIWYPNDFKKFRRCVLVPFGEHRRWFWEMVMLKHRETERQQALNALV